MSKGRKLLFQEYNTVLRTADLKVIGHKRMFWDYAPKFLLKMQLPGFIGNSDILCALVYVYYMPFNALWFVLSAVNMYFLY